MPNPFAIDKLICGVDSALRTVFVPKQRISNRASPAADIAEASMSSQEKRHAAGLMRVNHAGEVCAQALYQGQALTSKLKRVKAQMDKAAQEEIEHLSWCEQRLSELNSQPSLLNPFWYSGSLMLGILAGWAGDQWSLGFVAETERQVATHLREHLQGLPVQDEKSKAIVKQMETDETQHANAALKAGGAELPYPIKYLMNKISKLMTKSSYYI
jgi:ubiquinone biosynthesis monooxygenase Coq7